MNGISFSLSGDIRYTSHAPERFGAERGRESFRIDIHRGATGPMMFAVDVTIQFHGSEEIEVEAGHFTALSFSIVDVPGTLKEHPPYNLWCTDDGHFVLLKAEVGRYMKTAYELVSLRQIGEEAQ